ncbi:MAG: hypothetical protein D6785_05920, partial [Planctomycetota bacterium]
MKARIENPCQKMEQYFQSYLDGELTPKEKQIIDGHFQSCEECKRLFQKYGKVYKQLKSIFWNLAPKGKMEGLTLESLEESEEMDSSSLEVPGFKILELMGQGSMGKVYKAVQISLG